MKDKTKQIGVWLSEEDYKNLEEQSKKLGLGMSTYARMLILKGIEEAEYLENREDKPYG